MNARTIAAMAAGVAVAFGVTDGPQASADPAVAGFGTQLQAADTDGAGVGGYTVHDLQRSPTDVLNVPIVGNVPLAGTLWEARTDVDAVTGSVVPAMQFFNARAADGQSYRVLVQTFAPDLGISPLSQGGSSGGKIYFDVTGPAPTEVVYDDGQSRLTWAG
ncbi:DUF1942 domain-containing protein [Mycobacterium sp. Root265]|uniref:DUF1942 domain-containing protein n=1 Tax=Mycobacterium sp. Root265 TaxID=1736504 RepID=UPI0009E83988|nr:DUF1942 domain-containing protein [Mycobacterium sp. Root265]